MGDSEYAYAYKEEHQILSKFTILFAQSKAIIVSTRDFKGNYEHSGCFWKKDLVLASQGDWENPLKCPTIAQQKQHHPVQQKAGFRVYFALHSLTKYSLQYDAGCC